MKILDIIFVYDIKRIFHLDQKLMFKFDGNVPAVIVANALILNEYL